MRNPVVLILGEETLWVLPWWDCSYWSLSLWSHYQYLSGSSEKPWGVTRTAPVVRETRMLEATAIVTPVPAEGKQPQVWDARHIMARP